MEGETCVPPAEAVRRYEPWRCECMTLNLPNTYICLGCSGQNQEVKQGIIDRKPYKYPLPQRVEEAKVVADLEGCHLCGEVCLNGTKICDLCRNGVGEVVAPNVPVPKVPVNLLRPWKCENCETENYDETNCRNCAMIRKS